MKLNPIKFKKMAKILRVFMNVLFWATIIGGSIFLLSCLFVILAPAELLKHLNSGNMSISLDFNGIMNYKVNVDSGMLETYKLKSIFSALMPAVAIGFSMLAVIIRQIRNILISVEKDVPFEEQNSKRITIIGTVLIIGSVVLKISQAVFALTMIRILQITDLDVKFTFDGTMLTAGFLILILAGVFKYGNFLQKEYDATL